MEFNILSQSNMNVMSMIAASAEYKADQKYNDKILEFIE
jgi:hypothetical protein